MTLAREQGQHNTAFTIIFSTVDAILKDARKSTKVCSKIDTAMNACRATVPKSSLALKTVLRRTVTRRRWKCSRFVTF